MGEAKDPKTPAVKGGIPGPVALKRVTVPVVAEAVDLDDQAPVAPEEIDLVGSDTRIHVGQGKAVAPAEVEKQPLELAAGEVRVAELLGADQSKIESPPHGAPVDRVGNRAV